MPRQLRGATAVGTMQPPPDARFDAASDEALLVAYAEGDLRAARALTLRLTPRLLGFAQRMLGHDGAEAEDVVQETMLRLWQTAPDWRQGEARVSTWLYRVAANLCIDRLRRRGRAVTLDAAGEPLDGRPAAETGLIARDRAAALNAALMQLPERQRQAVTLRHLEGLGNAEIARIMDIGIEAVESLTSRGRRSLLRMLAPRRGELGFDDE